MLVVGFVWWGFGEGPGLPVAAEPVVVQVTFVPLNPQRRELELLPEEPFVDPVPVPVIAVEELQPVVLPSDDVQSDLALDNDLVPDLAPDEESLQELALQPEATILEERDVTLQPALELQEEREVTPQPELTLQEESLRDDPLREESQQDAAPPDENLQDLAEQSGIEDEPGNFMELQPGTRQLENAVAGYMQGYRSSSVERWVDACRPSRPRAPDAPPCLDEQLTGDARRLQQQAWAAELFVTPQSRRAESERLFNQMLAESRYLETLTGDNTVLGQLARERFATLKENYCALNTTHRACSGDFADTISDVVTLISVGSP